VTQFILEQQELKLKKNSKSRKKRKQNSEDEEGEPALLVLLHKISFPDPTLLPPRVY
jgi:hypothetical protein